MSFGGSFQPGALRSSVLCLLVNPALYVMCSTCTFFENDENSNIERQDHASDDDVTNEWWHTGLITGITINGDYRQVALGMCMGQLLVGF